MSVNLDNAKRTIFDDRVKVDYESAGPDLRPCVSYRAVSGVDTYTFRTMGRALAEQRVVSQSELNNQDVSHGTVTCTLQNWYASELTDLFDQDKTNAPQEIPALAGVLANAVKRRETQLVIDAMDAATPGTTIAAGAAGMTADKLLQAREALKANDIMEPLCLLIAEEQERDLLTESGNKFTSADFAAASGAVTGDVRQGHFGINNYKIIGSGRSESGLSKSGNDRSCYLFVPSAVGLVCGFGGSPKTEVNYESDKAAWRSTVMIRANAAVIDTSGIVEIVCTED